MPVFRDLPGGDVSLCPVPETGTAVPTCTMPAALPADTTGPETCILTCDADETCPDGMQCVDMWELGHRVCAWVAH